MLDLVYLFPQCSNNLMFSISAVSCLARAMEGKRLLDLARAKNRKVTAPPSTITTTKLSKP